MFCHHCGTQVGPEAGFCPNCGQPVGAAGTLSPALPLTWTPPAGVQSQTGRWIGEGWRLVKNDLGGYFLLALVFSILNAAVPLILQGPLIVGFHIFTMKKL